MLIYLVTESQITGSLSSSGRMQELVYPDTPISRNAYTPGHKVTIFWAHNKEREKLVVRPKCRVLSLYRQHAAVLNAGGGTITLSLSRLRYRADTSFLTAAPAEGAATSKAVLCCLPLPCYLRTDKAHVLPAHSAPWSRVTNPGQSKYTAAETQMVIPKPESLKCL